MNGKGWLAVTGIALVAAIAAAVGASADSSSEAAGFQSGGGKGARFFVVTPKPGALTITQVRMAGLKPNMPKPRIVPVSRKELPPGKERRKATIIGYSVVKLPKQKAKSRGASTGERPRVLAGTATVSLPIFAETTLYGSVRGAVRWEDPKLDLETAGSQWEIKGKPIRATISSSGRVTNRRGLEAICESLPNPSLGWRSLASWSGSFTGIDKPVRLAQVAALACGDAQGLKVLAGILSGRGVQPPSPPPSGGAPTGTWRMGPVSETSDPFGQPVYARGVWGQFVAASRAEIDGVRFNSSGGVPSGGVLVDDSGSAVGGPGSTGAAGKDFFIFGGFGANARLNFCLFWKRAGPRPDNRPTTLQTINTDQTRDDFTVTFVPQAKFPCDF